MPSGQSEIESHTFRGHLIGERKENDCKNKPQTGNDVDRHAGYEVHGERASVHGPAEEQDVGEDGDQVGEVIDRARQIVSRVCAK